MLNLKIKKTYIKTEIERYNNNEINRLEFIKNVCYKFLP
jgi:hypothetical protein